MAGEFLQGFSAGAGAANMRVMRQERMMELRAREAQRQIQERQVAAQAEMLTQRAEYYHQQALAEQAGIVKQNAVARAVGDMFEQNKARGLDDDENLERLIAPVAAVDADMGAKLALAYQRRQSGKAAVEKEKFTPVIEGIRNPVGGKLVPVLRTGPNSATLVSAKSKAASPVLRAEIGAIYSRVKTLQKAHDEIEPEQGAVKNHPNTIKRMKLSAAIAGLKAQARALERGAVDEGDGSEGEPEEEGLFEYIPGKGIMPVGSAPTP